MAQVEMIIDSVRRKSLSDEWVVILKAKGAERYLPIYVGPSQADIIKRLSAKALALGVRAEAPIFADEALLDKSAIEVPSSGTVI